MSLVVKALLTIGALVAGKHESTLEFTFNPGAGTPMGLRHNKYRGVGSQTRIQTLKENSMNKHDTTRKNKRHRMDQLPHQEPQQSTKAVSAARPRYIAINIWEALKFILHRPKFE